MFSHLPLNKYGRAMRLIELAKEWAKEVRLEGIRKRDIQTQIKDEMKKGKVYGHFV